MDETRCDLDSPSEWNNAYLFYFEILKGLEQTLPKTVVNGIQVARHYHAGTATAFQLEAARAGTWAILGKDSLGETPKGAAIRAALFFISEPDPQDGPLDTVSIFASFALKAGVPQSALETAFRRTWCQEQI